jgi:hypothetical protein
MVGIWGCRGASSVGCLLSLIPASSRNKEGGKTEVMAEVVIVLGIRNAVSQIIYKISGGDIRHRKEGRHKEDQADKFADNEIRDKRHLDPLLEGSFWLAAVNRSGRASGVGTMPFP